MWHDIFPFLEIVECKISYVLHKYGKRCILHFRFGIFQLLLNYLAILGFLAFLCFHHPSINIWAPQPWERGHRGWNFRSFGRNGLEIKSTYFELEKENLERDLVSKENAIYVDSPSPSRPSPIYSSHPLLPSTSFVNGVLFNIIFIFLMHM